MQGQARLRRWSMGGAISPKLCLAQRSEARKKKNPENETSPGPETLLSSSWP